MSSGTLYDNVWDIHKVRELPGGEDQIFIGLHLIHEVTSPQAFGMLEERDLDVAFPERTYATCDHIVPTHSLDRPFEDEKAEEMMQELEENVEQHGITFLGPETGKQGIVHVIGPELGLTQPGMTIACGDSHTSTHGAFGCLGVGVGTSQIRDILATGCISLEKKKVRKIDFDGLLNKGVYPKDMILKLISKLGVDGGVGYVYEYSGTAIQEMGMEGRMSICNMSIEGGARAGYVNPDHKTFEYLKDREYAPDGEWGEAVEFWNSIKSEPDAEYDDIVHIDVDSLEPVVTWGINPGQAIEISESIPEPTSEGDKKALDHMGFEAGQSMRGVEIDVAFLGSCTNARISDLREAARVLEVLDRKVKVDRALVVPGSQGVKKKAEEEGLDEIFKNAGFDWRGAGCSMCLGMNPDQLQRREICASSSNRNFIGRQGSKDGRTVLMSPAMVIGAAVEGEVIDIREIL